MNEYKISGQINYELLSDCVDAYKWIKNGPIDDPDNDPEDSVDIRYANSRLIFVEEKDYHINFTIRKQIARFDGFDNPVPVWFYIDMNFYVKNTGDDTIIVYPYLGPDWSINEICQIVLEFAKFAKTYGGDYW